MTSHYHSSCPNCAAQNAVDTAKFTLAAGKIHCVQCRCIFDAKRHRIDAPIGLNAAPIVNPDAYPVADKSQRANIPHLNRHVSATQHKTAAGKGHWFGAVLALILVLTLISQLAYFNRATWSQQPQLQALYSHFERWLSPGIWALQQIEQDALNIAPHPVYQNSLLVQFTLINHGALTVNAPDVILSFSDLHGKVTAQRRFSIEDYRPAGTVLTTLNARQKIRAQLEILAPSERGLNYQLTLQTAKVPFFDDK